MKKLTCLMLVLLLCLSCCAALASTYEIEALEVEMELPDGLTVVNETETDEAVVLQLELDGRGDCMYTVTFSYFEDYEGYYTATLPDDLLEDLIAGYTNQLDCENEPSVIDITGGEDETAEVNPLFVAGKDANGQWVIAYTLVLDGWYFQVTGATSAEEFDEDSYGAAFNLYFAGMELFMGEE